MELQITSVFKKSFKKLHDRQKETVKKEIKLLMEDPTIGEEKKQDLRGVYVHKFNMDNQLYLLAYTFDPITLKLILLGVHENFYRSLKNFLK